MMDFMIAFWVATLWRYLRLFVFFSLFCTVLFAVDTIFWETHLGNLSKVVGISPSFLNKQYMVKLEERMFAIKRALKTQLVFSQNSLMATCPCRPVAGPVDVDGRIIKSSAFYWVNKSYVAVNKRKQRQGLEKDSRWFCSSSHEMFSKRLVTWWTCFCFSLGYSVSTLSQGYNILILPTTGRFFQVPGWRWCMVYVWVETSPKNAALHIPGVKVCLESWNCSNFFFRCLFRWMKYIVGWLRKGNTTSTKSPNARCRTVACCQAAAPIIFWLRAVSLGAPGGCLGGRDEILPSYVGIIS